MLWSPVLRLLAQRRILTVQKLEEPLAELLAKGLWVKAHVQVRGTGQCGPSLSSVVLHTLNAFINQHLNGMRRYVIKQNAKLYLKHLVLDMLYTVHTL